MSEKIIPWVEHLEELRKRVIAIAISLAVFFCLGLVIHQWLIAIIQFPLGNLDTPLYFTAPAEGFLVALKASLFFSFFCTTPVVLWQLWQFLKPGLLENEKKAVFPLFTVSVSLFLIGVSFCYFLVLPTALKFLLGFGSSHFQPLLSVSRYSSFVCFMLLGFGISFNLPIVVLALAHLNIVSAAWLRHQRKFVLLGIVVLAAVLTPSPDALSQILLAIPLFVLYEATILVVSWLEKRKILKSVEF